MIVKIDLSKSYERINWLYVCPLLTNMGFCNDFINFIMVNEMKYTLDLFVKATCMSINAQKSSISYEGLSDVDLEKIEVSLPFKVLHMGDNLKYLSFFLKLDSYKNQDWNWLLKKIEK